jgi:hypothetical protein
MKFWVARSRARRYFGRGRQDNIQTAAGLVMWWGQDGRATRARIIVAVAFAATLLAGCNTIQSGLFASNKGPASIAFDSIDGPPPAVFQRLVRDLNSEAKSRQLTVLSRDDEPTYRARGYLGAQIKTKDASITWVWDVYDAERQRVLRISGEEKVAGKHRNPWDALDDAGVQRIARKSVEQLGVFLAAVDRPAPVAVEPTATSLKEGSPEAEGIVRISTSSQRPVTVAQGERD